MARRYNLFIDGQNVTIEFIPQIMDYCGSIGIEQEDARLYASTTEIAKIVAKSGPLLADYDIDAVSVPCKPRKNSVDIRMAVDIIEEAAEDTDSDVVIVATNDSDFTHVASRVISYKSEFHLLHTGAAPSGYSKNVKMTRLKQRSRREVIAGKVKQVAALMRPPKGATEPPRAAGFAPDPSYSHNAALRDLSPAGFAMRIMAASPIVIDSRCLFAAWKDFSGHAWKGRNSKKSAQQFFDEHFPAGAYRFREWTDKSVNQGYFLCKEYSSIEVSRVMHNGVISMLGSAEELIEGQCAILAEGLRKGSYENFNVIFDESADRNLLPRYGAWGIMEAALRANAQSESPPRWSDPVERNPEASAEALRLALAAEIRRQFESGEIALEPVAEDNARDEAAAA